MKIELTAEQPSPLTVEQIPNGATFTTPMARKFDRLYLRMRDLSSHVADRGKYHAVDLRTGRLFIIESSVVCTLVAAKVVSE